MIDFGKIPLMPGAIPEGLIDKTYSFMIKVKPYEVKDYYETELIKKKMGYCEITTRQNNNYTGRQVFISIYRLGSSITDIQHRSSKRN